MAYLDETGLAKVWNKIKALIPTKTSELLNDSGFATQSQIPTVNNATLTIKQNGTTKGTFSANASSNVEVNLESGGGGASTWDEISGKPTVFPPESHNHSKSDIVDFPSIPTKTSELTNDSGFLTEHQDISGKSDVGHKHVKSDITDFPTLSDVATSGNYNDLSNKPTIPTVPSNVSAFNNDAGYLTEHQDISGKQDKLVSGTNIKTINNQSLLGSGNINISGGGGGASSWDDITDKPSVFPPAEHTHTTDDLTNYGTLPTEATKTGATVKSSAQTLCGLSLEPGTWLLIGFANFAGTSSGTTQYVRQIAIATGIATDGEYRQRMVAPSNQAVTLCVVRLVTISAQTTYNLNAYSTYSTGFTTSGRLQAIKLK